MASVPLQVLMQLLSTTVAIIRRGDDPHGALSSAADCIAHLTLASTLNPRQRKDVEVACEQMLAELRTMPCLREYDTSALHLKKGAETQLYRDIIFWRDTVQWQGRLADKKTHIAYQDNLRTLWDQAKQALQSDNMPKAKRYLQKFCELHRDKTAGISLAASLLISSGKDHEAVFFLQDALRKMPEATALLRLLVVTLNRLREHRQAIDALRSYAKIEGYSPEIHLSMAALFLNMSRFQDAQQQARKALDTVWQTQREQVAPLAQKIMDFAAAQRACDCLPQDEEAMFGIKDAHEKMLASLKRKAQQGREP